jgi:hypothetical protein
MVKGQQPKKIDYGRFFVKGKETDEKETNHPAHPMDRTANWCSHGRWFTLVDMRYEKLDTCGWVVHM